MSITNEAELAGMKKVSEAVAITLKEMTRYAAPGMTTKQLDEYGAEVLNSLGAHVSVSTTSFATAYLLIKPYLKRATWLI
jgi:methionine aminopeptidase